MRTIVACFALLSCMQASVCLAADADCADGKTGAVHRECLDALATKTGGEVGRLEGQLRSRIALWEREPADIRRSLALFEQDRDAYRTYRQAHCALQSSSAAHRNDADDTRIACGIDLDRGRIAAIKVAMTGFDPGD